MTHFLSHLRFKKNHAGIHLNIHLSVQEKKLLWKNKCQQLYHTFFESDSIQEQILKHEGNYEVCYYTFLDFFSSQEQNLMFQHFLE